MCLYTYTNRKKASEDFIVYKRFEIRTERGEIYNFRAPDEKLYLSSPMRDYIWRTREGHPTVKVKQVDGHVEEGYHSHSTLEEAWEQGYHDEIIVECIVPKGSQYYESGNHIVASNIVITENYVHNTHFEQHYPTPVVVEAFENLK